MTTDNYQPDGVLAQMLGDMAAALAEEAKHAQNEASWIRLRNGRRLRVGLDRTLYCFDADSDLWFPPGTTAELSVGDGEPAPVEVLEVRGQSVWLESPGDLGGAIAFARLRSNPWYLLDALRLRIDELRGVAGAPEDEAKPYDPEDLRLVACLLGLAEPVVARPDEVAEGAARVAAGYEGLPANQSQLAAVAACLDSELRFVWGPPGTGKTETLGLLAAEAYLRGESVLVLAHSNAAVDAAAIALVRNLALAHPGREIGAAGECVRAGDPFLQEAQDLPVTERAVLARQKPELVARLERLEGRGAELMDGQDSLFGDIARTTRSRSAVGDAVGPGRELGRVTEELRRVREQVGRAQRDLVADAQLVLTTLSKAAITPEVFERRFDRVLVDEASMAQPPQVVLAASLATRGPHGSLAVFGDFRQLAPVVQSWSRSVKQWLGRDVFELNGLTRNVEQSHLLSVLSVQYRMHPKIMGLVNGPSYGGRLSAGPGIEEATAQLARYRPVAGEPVVWIDTGEFGARAYTTRTHSRINPFSAWLALQVALELRQDGMGSIGIVTPYRDQARLLRLLVRAAGVGDAVHTGTIHRFQGGERDAIILDLVDSAPLPPGVLFRSDDGLRLLNVAVTRARGKLICLSDGAYLRIGGRSNSPVWAILAGLCRCATPLDPASVIDAGVPDAGWAVMKPSEQTALQVEHDISQSAEVVAFGAGLPGWAAAPLRDRPGAARREDGSRLLLLSNQVWLFPRQEPWALRISEPQVVKLLMESVGTPPAARSSRAPAGPAGPPVRPVQAGGVQAAAGPAPGPLVAAVPGEQPSIGTCRHCNDALGVVFEPASGRGPRIACTACGAFERDAEAADLTAAVRSLGLRCTCGSEWRCRKGPRGLFFGCAGYPGCRNTQQLGVLLRALAR